MTYEFRNCNVKTGYVPIKKEDGEMELNGQRGGNHRAPCYHAHGCFDVRVMKQASGYQLAVNSRYTIIR
jgi:hypothetical protein